MEMNGPTLPKEGGPNYKVTINQLPEIVIHNIVKADYHRFINRYASPDHLGILWTNGLLFYQAGAPWCKESYEDYFNKNKVHVDYFEYTPCEDYPGIIKKNGFELGVTDVTDIPMWGIVTGVINNLESQVEKQNRSKDILEGN